MKYGPTVGHNRHPGHVFLFYFLPWLDFFDPDPRRWPLGRHTGFPILGSSQTAFVYVRQLKLRLIPPLFEVPENENLGWPAYVVAVVFLRLFFGN